MNIQSLLKRHPYLQPNLDVHIYKLPNGNVCSNITFYFNVIQTAECNGMPDVKRTLRHQCEGLGVAETIENVDYFLANFDMSYHESGYYYLCRNYTGELK